MTHNNTTSIKQNITSNENNMHPIKDYINSIKNNKIAMETCIKYLMPSMIFLGIIHGVAASFNECGGSLDLRISYQTKEVELKYEKKGCPVLKNH